MGVKLDDVINLYVELRDKKAKIEKSVKEQTKPIKERMDKLEAYLLRELQTQGVTSFKTPGGTAFIATQEWATVSDWETALQFIRDNDAYDLLERRVSKIAVRTLVDEGNAPPGVNYGTKLGVNIRRPNS
tara:strand:- start:301 stop:690 length:390 start_codon:yes stop_codon:yes gene_type:complete